jgi:hypothetical protein
MDSVPFHCRSLRTKVKSDSKEIRKYKLIYFVRVDIVFINVKKRKSILKTYGANLKRFLLLNDMIVHINNKNCLQIIKKSCAIT